jgi:hypothetical protein
MNILTFLWALYIPYEGIKAPKDSRQIIGTREYRIGEWKQVVTADISEL